MKDDETYEPDWPQRAGDPDVLPREIPPPDALESRLVSALLRRELIRPTGEGSPRPFVDWRRLASVAAVLAGAVALLATGFFVGATREPSPGTQDSGARDPDLYALLLYETERYDSPDGSGELALYQEYSAWVARAAERDQFVTGEDFDTDDGWTLVPGPGGDGPVTERRVSIGSDAALSGIFIIRAAVPEEALSLAAQLPHLRRGGSVVVQRVLPTDRPPTPDRGR